MSWQSVVAAILLTIGVVIELACCVGILAMSNVYDRLHYLGPAVTIGPVAIAAAIVVREANSQAGLKAMLVAALMMILSPVLTHATARAFYAREADTAAANDRQRP